MKVFRSKVDLWLILVLFASLVLPVVIGWFVPESLPFVTMSLAPMILLLAWHNQQGDAQPKPAGESCHVAGSPQNYLRPKQNHPDFAKRQTGLSGRDWTELSPNRKERRRKSEESAN